MKIPLRKELRDRRRALGVTVHAKRSALAARAVMRLPHFRFGARVAVYLPFDGEADTAALIMAARRRGLAVYVPVVIDRRHRRLRFFPLSTRTRRGAFGIPIPHDDDRRAARWITPRWFDLIVVPLVGIDTHGRRLGMGGGFYDRALAFRRHRRHWKGPTLVGFAFDCQRTEVAFADAWDARLDDLATESGLTHFLELMA